ncbi:hypothetical protein LIER_32179 [Lithospermum erythrorhizon]|uniref:MADS-box domain-containing protein n=1 Tax=Lithospermum erythrorhizon TaxID=34254 RepID=A0AAV3RYH4_LITER
MAEPSNEPKNTKGGENASNDNENIEVTFANYVYVIFKKASKICTLYDAKVAIFLFSPNGTAYSFGHPSVDEVVNNYLVDASTDGVSVNHSEEARRVETFQGLNAELTSLKELLNKEKEREARLNALKNEGPNKDNLNLKQLEELKSNYENLLAKVNMEKASALEVEGGEGAVAGKVDEADVGPYDGTKNENI